MSHSVIELVTCGAVECLVFVDAQFKRIIFDRDLSDPSGGTVAEVMRVNDDDRVSGSGEFLGKVISAVDLISMLLEHGMIPAAVHDAFSTKEHRPTPGMKNHQPGHRRVGFFRQEKIAIHANPGRGIERNFFKPEVFPLLTSVRRGL